MPILNKVKKGNYDKELVGLISELNKCGIKTTASCSGHGIGCAYLAIDMKSLVGIRVDKNALVIDWNIKKIAYRSKAQPSKAK